LPYLFKLDKPNIDLDDAPAASPADFKIGTFADLRAVVDNEALKRMNDFFKIFWKPYLDRECHSPDGTIRSRRRVGDGEARSDPLVVIDQKAGGPAIVGEAEGGGHECFDADGVTEGVHDSSLA
jgi:hypothetical protein